MMTLHEIEPMTAEEAARIAVILLDSGEGKIADDGGRPWLFVNLSNAGEARELRKALGRGFAKPRREEYGGRYGAWGNDALEIFEFLLDVGLNGRRGAIAEMLLEKYGDDGQPWASEVERLRAQTGHGGGG